MSRYPPKGNAIAEVDPERILERLEGVYDRFGGVATCSNGEPMAVTT